MGFSVDYLPFVQQGRPTVAFAGNRGGLEPRFSKIQPGQRVPAAEVGGQRRRHNAHRPGGLPEDGGAVGDRRRAGGAPVLQPVRRPPLHVPREAEEAHGAAGGGETEGEHAGSPRRQALGAQLTQEAFVILA